MKKNFSVKTVVATGIGAALFFVLGRFVAIPSPVPNTTVSIQYGLLAFMAAAFGPVAGLLIGFIGHALIDFSWGWGVWWSWVIASGVFGLIMGLMSNKIGLTEGKFGKKGVVLFNLAQIVGRLICWGAVAPALDVLIYNEPTDKLLLQGLVAGAANIVTTAIVGTLICLAYVAARPKEGSLRQEE